MRTNQRSKRTIYYALYDGLSEIVDTDGNLTGEQVPSYEPYVTARMNVSGGRGRADIELFGTDNPFTRTAVTDDLDTPFNTDTIFWFESDPETESYNYRCTGISRTNNQVVIALAEVDKSPGSYSPHIPSA